MRTQGSSSKRKDPEKIERLFWQLYNGSFTQNLDDLPLQCEKWIQVLCAELNNRK